LGMGYRISRAGGGEGNGLAMGGLIRIVLGGCRQGWGDVARGDVAAGLLGPADRDGAEAV
jgi:hypothetical protein